MSPSTEHPAPRSTKERKDMQKITMITVIAASAGLAAASTFTSVGDSTSTGQSNQGTIETMTIDIPEGTPMWGSWLNPDPDTDNISMLFDIGANSHVIGFGMDLTVTTYAPAQLWEVGILASNSTGQGGLVINPFFDFTSGTASFSTEGEILDVIQLGLDFFVLEDGLLRIEYYHGVTSDPAPGALNGIIEGSLTVQYATIPAPGALAVLGLGGLITTRRRR